MSLNPSSLNIMSPFDRHQYKYDPIQEDSDSELQTPASKQSSTSGTVRFLLLLLGFAAGLALGFTLHNRYSFLGSSTEDAHQPRHCNKPVTRREWRSLSHGEKKNYIDAIKCLSHTPSRVRDNGTLYDDFPWIHQHFGASSHASASFLSWHRYFLHLYERALREDCGYEGHLAYWNWSLDWEALHESPIWDPRSGFGGDGDDYGDDPVGMGRCVSDGPFKDLRLMFYNNEDNPHCLSRGFWDGQNDGNISGSGVSPSHVEDVLAQTDYEAFTTALERGPHNVIPNGVRGDFLMFTAPSDPVFFLHHAQLDRLWWLWQNRDLPKRLNDYAGNSTYGSMESGSLNDLLRFGGLGPDIQVEEIMSSTGGLLCYLY